MIPPRRYQAEMINTTETGIGFKQTLLIGIGIGIEKVNISLLDLLLVLEQLISQLLVLIMIVK